jgi:hypothetical protein
MFKQLIIVILLILTATVAISGCTTKTAPNGTFGEKFISVDSIYLSNNSTTGNYTYNGTEYYYIEGYLVNNNSYEAFHVKVNSIVYDANGNVIATNDSAYLDPDSIPGDGFSHFIVEFNDSSQKIVRYEVKVVNATGTF